MGSDKALLELAGQPLVRHAVTKLRRICREVGILGGDSGLAAFAPLVPDLHSGCGPLGGIEAALRHSIYDWNLILPVDVPFLPTAFLDDWVRSCVRRRNIYVALFQVFGVPQPTVLLIHRWAAPSIARAVAEGEFKLLPALEAAARELAPADAPAREKVPYMLPLDENMSFGGWTVRPRDAADWQVLTPAQRAAQPLWFSNLNTPEDFLLAEANIAALDT